MDARGRRRFALRYETLRRRLFRDRNFTFPRGDLERILYREVKDAVDIWLETTAQHLVQNKQGIELQLTNGSFEHADLVVGADGVRSLVRTLVFGPAERFRHSLGHVAAAWILTHVPDQVDAKAFTTLTVPGRIVAVYPTRDDRAATFLAHRTLGVATDLADGPGAVLLRIYGDLGSAVPEILGGLETAPSVYFEDRRPSLGA